MSGLTVVVNPRAGKGAFGPARVEALRRLVGPGGGLEISLAETDVDALCARVIGDGAQRVGIIGGDGTSASVITGLWRASTAQDRPMPQVALLRGGTMNTVANAVGVARGAPERLLSRLSATGGVSRKRECDTIEIDGRLGFLLSTGVMYGFLSEYYTRGSTGVTAAARLLARSVGSTLLGRSTSQRVLQSYEATLQLDGHAEPRKRYVLVGAGTIEEVGLGFRLFPRAHDARGMHVVGYHGGERALALAMPALSRGRCVGRSDVVEKLCERLVIETRGSSLGYSLDGDLYQSDGDLVVQLGPRLKLLLP